MSSFPDDEDGNVLAEIASHGVDMTKPLLIDFSVIAPDEDTAEAIAIKFGEHGYEAEMMYDDGEPLEGEESEDEEFAPVWSVIVERHMVPAYDEIIRIQRELSELAEPLGGALDGWGAMIE